MKLNGNNVVMTKKDFLAEHKRLTKILAAVANENKKQLKELREFKRRGK